MKQFLTLLTVGMSISFSAQAHLQMFKKQDAIQLVLNSPAVLAQISSSGKEVAMSAISVAAHQESVLTQSFLVRIATSDQSSAHSQACYKDIHLNTVIGARKSTAGLPEATNKLVITKIGETICKKSPTLAARIQQ